MKKLILTLAVSSISGQVLASDNVTFTPEQEAKIGEIAAQYLVDHPEFLIKASQKFSKNN